MCAHCGGGVPWRRRARATGQVCAELFVQCPGVLMHATKYPVRQSGQCANTLFAFAFETTCPRRCSLFYEPVLRAPCTTGGPSSSNAYSDFGSNTPTRQSQQSASNPAPPQKSKNERITHPHQVLHPSPLRKNWRPCRGDRRRPNLNGNFVQFGNKRLKNAKKIGDQRHKPTTSANITKSIVQIMQ